MAVGAPSVGAGGQGQDYPGGLTPFVFTSSVVAATGGLIFGYDIGISGGVTSMDPFLVRFFPSVYRKQAEAAGGGNLYCAFDSQLLTLFTSSLYVSALVASLFAASVTRAAGRRWSMRIGGITFLAGCVLNGAAVNVAMLVLGRVLLGVGVGFANQSVPVYLSEMAPARMRGMLNNAFQLMITVGILVANLVNYGTARIAGGWGWRLSLGLAAVPAVVMTVGSMFLPDTPNSLLERGHPEEARKMLRRVRGTDDVAAEFDDLVAAGEMSKLVTHPWRDILQRRYRPQLVMAAAIPLLQQLTGINVIMFYAPVLFKTLGFGGSASLMSAVITGLVNLVSTFVSVFTVDLIGRRALFLEGGAQMLAGLVAVGGIIGAKLGWSGVAAIPPGYAVGVVVVMCAYVAGFAWSWGPLGWLVPCEVMPLEVRPAGQSITVAVNMLMTFAVAQAFLPMLCRLRFVLFFVFAACVVAMTLFIAFFLPETKGVPIEDMTDVWKAHWYWRRFVTDQGNYAGGRGDVEMGCNGDGSGRPASRRAVAEIYRGDETKAEAPAEEQSGRRCSLEKEGGWPRRRGACVIGGGGFIASWLVKLLLSCGYSVHATLRDPDDPKNAHLRKLEGAPENLRLFKADMLHYDELRDAIVGCEGVFHLASPVPEDKIVDPEIEMLAPPLKGTLNVLQICSLVKVQKVVVVSSTSAVHFNSNWPQDRPKDESCWSDCKLCMEIEEWYSAAKTAAEGAAWKHAEKNSLKVVTVCPCLVFGLLLQSAVNTSSKVLIYTIKGGPNTMKNIMWHIVDVRDVADALILVYEKPESSGRYICSGDNISTKAMVELLKKNYPNNNYVNCNIDIDLQTAPILSEKLRSPGWKPRKLEETLLDSVDCYEKAGILQDVAGCPCRLPYIFRIAHQD